MLTVIPIGLLCGLLLGCRFKVFATIPVEFGAVLTVCGLAAGGAITIGMAALAFLIFSVCLQTGYVAMLIAGPRLQQSGRISPFQA